MASESQSTVESFSVVSNFAQEHSFFVAHPGPLVVRMVEPGFAP